MQRSASSRLGSLLGRAWQAQQRRAAGNLPVKQNSWVESWGTRREHVENDFRWDAPTLARLVVFAFGVPYLIYAGCVKEFNHVDENASRPKRDMWGSSGSQ